MSRQPDRRLLVVTALLRDHDGRVLVVRRGAGSRAYQGHWQFPEGKVELGEVPVTALRREVREEVALRVRQPRLLGVTHTVGEHGGEWLEIVRLIYGATARGVVRLGDGHAGFRWLKPLALARLRRLVPGTDAVRAFVAEIFPTKEMAREDTALYRTVRRRQVRRRHRTRTPAARPRSL